MEFEVKFYRLHDLDIVGLRDLGYPVQAMLRKALIEYAHGNPIHYIIDEPDAMTFTETKSFRVKIRLKDEDTIAMLKSLRPRHRNGFCKALLRNSLVHQTLAPYFSKNVCSPLEQKCIDAAVSHIMPNTFKIDKSAMKKRNLILKELAVSSLVNPSDETNKKIDELYASMESLIHSGEIKLKKNGEKAVSDVPDKKPASLNVPDDKLNTKHDISVKDVAKPVSEHLPDVENSVYSDNEPSDTQETDKPSEKKPDILSEMHSDNADAAEKSVSAAPKPSSDDILAPVVHDTPDTGMADDFDDGDDLMDMFDKLIND